VNISLAVLLPTWILVGVGTGVAVRWGSVWLARQQGLSAGRRAWQRLGPPVLCGLLFLGLALRLGPTPLMLIRSLWAAVLVQITFFDAEHRLVLDWILAPAAVVALALSPFTPDLGLVPAVLAGAAAGLAFLLLAIVGSLVFKAEAMGLGDVKLAAFVGLILGRLAVSGILIGVILAGAVGVSLVVLHLRSMRDSIPYGPFLTAGAMACLLAFT
jgi:leader peptidase (prepilin peptidase)/N-methyltransferase